MNYKEGLKKVIAETTTSYGGVYGANLDIGTHGGAFNATDWYAPGDARNPFGLDTEKKGKKGKKKKKKKNPFPVYRRAFVETLTTEAVEPDLQCALFCVDEWRDIADRLIEKLQLECNILDEVRYVSGTDEQLQGLIENISITVGEHRFTENYLALIGEMNNYQDLIKKPRMRETDYNQEQLRNGTKIEIEHTPDMELAKHIAMHHLDEDEFYYDKLHKMERLPKSPDQPAVDKRKPFGK